MKPIGKGETDQNKTLTKENEFQNKIYKGANYENHSIIFQDKANKGREDNFNHPDLVATDEFSNKRFYEETVGPKIPLFIDGFSMNFVAYGQTGSGKSHTMIGPKGVFDNESPDIENLDENLGLFPRAAMEILKGLQAKPEKTAMTISISESNFRHPMDLITKSLIWMDPTTDELIGMKEIPIETPADIYKVGLSVEKERTVGATKFNNVSSRTHCMIWIKAYT